MRFISFLNGSKPALGIRRGQDVIDLGIAAPGLPTDLKLLLGEGPAGLLAAERAVAKASSTAVKSIEEVELLSPIAKPGKILCVGLNYIEHIKESPTPQQRPDYPVVFGRYADSLVAHAQPLRRPLCSEQFDFEGELACIIGKRGRRIPVESALEFIGGYSIFNDASVRDYQFKSHQWMIGKNFDATGGFGPEIVTADELPSGANGLRLTTHLNGERVQSASTADMIFNVATLISQVSEAMTLMPGDIIVTGTPSGVGIGRKPPLWMKHGDICEVSVEGIGVLRNPVLDEERNTILPT